MTLAYIMQYLVLSRGGRIRIRRSGVLVSMETAYSRNSNCSFIRFLNQSKKQK